MPKAWSFRVASFLTESEWARSFQYRDFRLLWAASLFHSLCMGMDHVALGWLVLEMTDSPFMVGVASAARIAPFLFLGILSGAVSDRVDRRNLLRAIAWLGAVISGTMSLMLLAGVEQVWYVIALAAASGSFWAFQMTARHSYVYDIVGAENAMNGLALSAMNQRIGGVIGALFAGTFIAAWGLGNQYAVICVSYLVAAALMLTVRSAGQAAPVNREPVLKNLAGYVQVLRENRILRAMMFMTAITEVFGFTHQSVLPVFARDVLGVGAAGLGVMSAVRQGGGILALVLLAAISNLNRKGLTAFIVVAGFGLGQMAFYLTSNLVVFLVILAFINACASASDIIYRTIMQSNVSNEERGRAMGSWTLSIGMAPVGHLGIGGMAGVLGAQGALLVNGGILAILAVVSAIAMPRIRRLP